MNTAKIREWFSTTPGKIAAGVIAFLMFLTFIVWGFNGKNDSLFPVVRLYLVLFILLGIAYGIMKSLKLSGAVRPSSGLKITDKIPLETGVSIYVIEDETRQWVVSVGNKPMTVLDKTYKNEDSFEKVLADVENA